MGIFLKMALIILLFILVLSGGVWFVIGPVASNNQQELFTISNSQNGLDVAISLKENRFIKNTGAFSLLFLLAKDRKIVPGGYRLNRNMNAWQILQKITSKPDLVWVVIPEGFRKEQIGEVLAKVLGWSKEEVEKWNNVYTASRLEYKEGTYSPDTYLIPKDESGEEIAKRFINRFDEKMASLYGKFEEKNILWTSGVKIASLIQREAASEEDMPLISGIIWNRLEKGMKLDIDATLQYVRGKKDESWWSRVSISDKQIDSPYNTYRNKGLPPSPICNPGMDAIEAALNPKETECLFYLHDRNRQIHCAKTYEEHKENIVKYL